MTQVQRVISPDLHARFEIDSCLLLQPELTAMKASLLILSAAALLTFSAPAQNLVVNSGFELVNDGGGGGGGERGSGPLSYRPQGGLTPSAFLNWFETGDSTGVGDDSFGIAPRTGAFCAAFGQVGSIGSIFQEIPTIPGAEYVISFYLALEGEGGGIATPEGADSIVFSASWDGVSFYSRNDSGFMGTTPYQLLTFNVVASGNLTRLEFFGRNDPAWYYLDDVSVVSAVPEPGTWAAAVLAVGVVGYTVRRRRMVG